MADSFITLPHLLVTIKGPLNSLTVELHLVAPALSFAIRQCQLKELYWPQNKLRKPMKTLIGQSTMNVLKIKQMREAY